MTLAVSLWSHSAPFTWTRGNCTPTGGTVKRSYGLLFKGVIELVTLFIYILSPVIFPLLVLYFSHTLESDYKYQEYIAKYGKDGQNDL